jgi:protein-S-isoprenylcysteine O-methyltransferase Ste14
MIFSLSIEGDYLFKWTGNLEYIRGLVILISLYLFYAGSKPYDIMQFLGIRQIKDGLHHKSLTTSGNLEISGILGVIRHPWYTAAILLIWNRDIDISVLIVNVIFTLYLIIGTFLEERKLVIEFGDNYRFYQQKVSMLFPYKWIKSKISLKRRD